MEPTLNYLMFFLMLVCAAVVIWRLNRAAPSAPPQIEDHPAEADIPFGRVLYWVQRGDSDEAIKSRLAIERWNR